MINMTKHYFSTKINKNKHIPAENDMLNNQFYTIMPLNVQKNIIKHIQNSDILNSFVGNNCQIKNSYIHNCIIYDNCNIQDSTLNDCIVYKDCIIYKCDIQDKVIIYDSCQLKNSQIYTNISIGAYSNIGPFSHIHNDCDIQDNCRIGNFVEIKKSAIGQGTKIAHLSYVGDATIGDNVNIGAGVIFCNYDGKNKHKSFVGNNTFVGSNSMIIAPRTIGNNCRIGAGSCITEDIVDDSFYLTRTKDIKYTHNKYLD